jgi:cytochrome c-type biogenesis protein CcmH/NrfG
LSPIDTALQKLDTSSTKTSKAKAVTASAAASVAEPEPEIRSGGFGRALSALLFIVIGAAIGAAVYYFAFPPKISDTPPPQITEMKTQNIPLTAFEENRRSVDRNPGAYLTANGANPQDAEDYFLVGRAYLLTGKYWDAKQAFNEAKNRLASANQSDAKTLSTEIAMALAIINNGPAQQAFAKDIADQGTASNANTSVSSNANVGSNAVPDANSDLMSNVNH